MQLPAKQTRVAARLYTPKFSCGCVRAYGRTVVWMDKSDVITKPKVLAFTGYQILLAMGLRTHASGVRSSAIIFLERHSGRNRPGLCSPHYVWDLTMMLNPLRNASHQHLIYPSNILTYQTHS